MDVTKQAETPYTDDQWSAMCDANISRPVALHEADVADVWVYYRPWGLMYVPFGWHQRAMATLYAFHHGYSNYLTHATALGVPGYRAMETLADRFILEIEGTAFRSSMGESIIAGRHSHLDSRERQAFRRFTVCYLED